MTQAPRWQPPVAVAGLLCVPGRTQVIERVAHETQLLVWDVDALRGRLASLGLVDPLLLPRVDALEDRAQAITRATCRFVISCDGCCRQCDQAPPQIRRGLILDTTG